MRRLFSRLDLWLVAAVLALALGRLQARSAIQDFIGRQLPLALPRLLPNAGTAATALAALLAPLPLGWAFCLWRQRRGPGLDAADRLVVLSVVPLVLLGSLFAALVAAGALTAATFGAGLALLLAAGLAALARELRLARPAGWREALGPTLGMSAAATAALVLGGLFSLHLGQDYNFDLRCYHYFNVYAWFNGGPDMRLAVADRMGFFNPLCDVPSYVLIQRLPPVWVGFVLGASQSLPAVLAFALAWKVLRAVGAFGTRPVAAALLCAVAGAFEPVCVTELGGTMNDNALTALVLASLTAAVVALAEVPDGEWRRRLAWLAGAGVLAGLAAGLKLTLSTYCVAGAAAVLAATPGYRARIGATAGFCAAVVAGFLATNGYWMLKLQATVGSPTYPFFNSVFHSPYFPAVEMPIAGANGPWPWRLLAVPFGIMSFGRHSAMEVPFADVRLALLVVLLPAAAVVTVWRRFRRGGPAEPTASRVKWLLAAFAVVSYLIWDERFFIVRYCCPLMVTAPLLAVLLLQAFVPRGRALLVAAAVACLLIVGGMKVSSYGRVRWTDDFLQVEKLELDMKPGAVVIVTWRQSGELNPITHLLTLLPRDTVYFNLDSQMLQYARARQDAEAVVAAHPGPIYLLSNPCAVYSVSQEIRGRFRLQRKGDPVGRLEAAGVQLELWQLERLPDGPL